MVMTDIGKYLDFVLSMTFAFSFAFEIPVLIYLALWTGMTSIESLSNKRPYIIVLCFIIGMLLTPPDVISQILFAIPCWLLFEFGLLMGRLIPKEGHSQIKD
jgi:sec-independent protein translocase protein TatC